MDLAAFVVQGLQQLQRSQYFSASALIIYVYEYLVTFDQELELVWKSKWTLVKIFFLVNRYLAVPNIAVQQFLLGTTREGQKLSCEGLVQAFIFLTTIATFLSESILCIRLYLMWGKDKKIIIGLVAMFVGVSTYYITLSEMTLKLVKLDPGSPIAHLLRGCVLDVRAQHAYILFIVLISSDALKLTLALIPTFRIYKSEPIFRSSLMADIYREGVLFYVYLCVYTVTQLILTVQSAHNAVAMVPLFIVIRVVLASRMVLHIRQLYTDELRLTHSTGTSFHTTYM